MIPRDLLPVGCGLPPVPALATRWHLGPRRRLRDWFRAADGRYPDPSAAVLDAQSIISGEGGQARGFDMASARAAVSGTWLSTRSGLCWW
jgi:hypothetical protein